jgi:bacteriocin-like protein
MLLKYKDFKQMSNDEMKKIQGGLKQGYNVCKDSSTPCYVVVEGDTWIGNCGPQPSNPNEPCTCITQGGGIQPSLMCMQNNA